MKKIAFLIIACLSLGIQAQNSQKAEQLLNEVSKKVSDYNNMVIDFKYALENTSENIHQETRGDASIQGDKYVLNFMGTTQLFDGKKVYTIIPEDEEINISNYVPEDENNITPSKMFTFYQDGYNFAWDITQNVNGRTIQYVKLTPKDSEAEVKNILLGIDKETKNIYNLIQTQPNGTKITITVKSFKTNQSLAKNLFTFDESRYSNYYINRLD
ncbi:MULTISPECIES: LolA family protein [unclassified Zunongwangia]|uniref:LolA family protein n=1 Tax=unclassified Zunongwangia TaxID=2632541 RepID=UPI0022DE80DB|nr:MULTISPECIES: outer membrane lipoprotein carrier protein LolA [unclassified Zunongwangia]WBL21323.1 outer membrane lipoprotein carrier protein LolA [Zunongwangia sp. HRR-M8]WBL26825.1 outer membrane lipoprotein carrier protein LolA [Zunongwangia sp. HGR-M22]